TGTSSKEVVDHVLEWCRLTDSLDRMGHTQSEPMKCFRLLLTFAENEHLSGFAKKLRQENIKELEKLKKRIFTEIKELNNINKKLRVNDTPTLPLNEEAALYSNPPNRQHKRKHSDSNNNNNSNTKMQRLCFNCKRPGHPARLCRFPNGGASDNPNPMEWKHATQEQRERAARYYQSKRSKYESKEKAYMGQTEDEDEDDSDIVILPRLPHKHPIILDTGCTSHVVSDPDRIYNVREANVSVEGYVGRKIINQRCDAEFDVQGGVLVLEDALYEPDSKRNLVSILKSLDRGASAIFNTKTAYIKYGSTYGIHAKLTDRLWTVQRVSYSTDPPERREHCYNSIEALKRRVVGRKDLPKVLSERHAQKIHRLLGHPSDCLMRTLGINPPANPCPKCKLIKTKRMHFNRQTTKMYDLLEQIHADLVYGCTTSIQGHKYLLVLVDDFSRYMWIIPLKTKDEVCSRFAEWHNMMINQHNARLKVFRSDRGSEFSHSPEGKPTELLEYLNNLGIKAEIAPTETPEMNGRAEAAIKHLKLLIKILLLDANLPDVFWLEAARFAVDIRNKLPHATLVNKRTPYSFLRKKEATYEHLFPFGCQIFTPKTKSKKKKDKGKWDPGNIEGIYLGADFSGRGHRIFTATSAQLKSMKFGVRNITSASTISVIDTVFSGNSWFPNTFPAHLRAEDIHHLTPVDAEESKEDSAQLSNWKGP
ncbi:MAG: transposase family protein, partial [Bacteroidota bacterium]